MSLGIIRKNSYSMILSSHRSKPGNAQLKNLMIPAPIQHTIIIPKMIQKIAIIILI